MRACLKRFGPELYDMATASLGLKVRMRLRVREAGVVGAFPPLEPNDSQENLVHCSEAGEVFRAEAPRHTPVQHYLHHLGLQPQKTRCESIETTTHRRRHAAKSW